MILNRFPVDPSRLKIVILSSPKTGNTWLRWLLRYAYGIQVVELPLEWAPGCTDDFPPSFVTHQHLFPSESLVRWLVESRAVVLTTIRHPADTFCRIFHYVKWHDNGVGPIRRNAEGGRGPSRKERAEVYQLLVSSDLCHFARLGQPWGARSPLQRFAGRPSVAAPRGNVQDRAAGMRRD
jgi:hypothetical protein